MKNTETVKFFLQKTDIPYSENISLKQKTWIKRGGIARLWIQPLSIEQLQLLCTYLYQHNIFFEIVGHTSNMYFLNTYNPEIVVSIAKLTYYEVSENEIVCECGVSISKLTSDLVNQGIEGFEGFISLPGTIAGAVVNNSGCYGSIISSVIISVDILLPSGKVRNFKNEELGYAHRTSFLKTRQINGIVLKCYFQKTISKDKEVLIVKANKNREHRKKNQETPDGNLGSTFANIKLKKTFYTTFVSVFRNILKPFVSENKRRKWSYMLLFKLHGKERLFSFVSDKNYNCYLWRKENADGYFFEYVEFIRQISPMANLEIEIKGKN